jgi:SAM-dependent methyltransferase
MNLPEIGTPAQFEALREFLLASGYTQERICQELGLEADTLDLVTLSDDLSARVQKTDGLNLLIRFFLLGEYVSLAEMESHIPGRTWAAIHALGLVEESPTDATRCTSSVALYPVGNLFVISDRWSEPDRKPRPSFPDVVYPALTRSTREFLRFLPYTPCGDFLEMCGGSGIAALIGASYAERSVTGDITERSTRFAEFNIRLNALCNVSSVQGDLYAPVEARTFDRIVAHPPYMPVLKPQEIYYGGGEDGEAFTRKIVEGLPKFLNPGGRLYCRTLGSDRKDSPFETRLRSWLGDAQNEFDIAFFVFKNLDPGRFALDTAVRKGTGQGEVLQWRALFELLHIRELVTGMVVVQRRSTDRPVFSVRRGLAAGADCADTEKVLEWETELADERCFEKIMATAPAVSPKTELLIRHHVQDGEFVPKSFTLTSTHPFLMDCQIQPWMGYLVSRCDGSRTIRQLYADCREAEWIQPETPQQEFARLVGMLVSSGFLIV